MELEELNAGLNAFITIHEIKGRPKGRLHGLTFGVKDVILTKGVRTTAGSRILADNVPDENATVVDRILRAGGTILGKTNTHEFAAGATNTSSVAGPARNPWDQDRITGGSSGGSAAGVAAGMFDVGIGTDTGGSITVPASLCGVVGFKPTTGAIATKGVIPLSWTLDTVGILASRVDLVRQVFGQLVDPRKKHVLKTRASRKPTLGYFMFSDDEASKALGPTLERLTKMFKLVKLDLPLLREKGAEARRVITLAEAATFHSDWLKTKSDLYFNDVKELLLKGSTIQATNYVRAVRMRTSLIDEFSKALADIDALVSPSTRISAPRISEVIGNELRYRDELLGIAELFNVLGAPSVSIPAGESKGMPVGLMLSGRPNHDGALLDVALRASEAIQFSR
jgi:aspartyl-tRNA(Asn)/glutamyl-tRNA(Gln) amidotransferase subunit A